jgi:hypothetical protein
MSFFRKLAGNTQKFFKKAGQGVDTVLRKTINTAGDIGGYIQKAAPILNAINPELGSFASMLGTGLGQGRQVLQQGRGVLNQARSGDIVGAIQKGKSLAEDTQKMNFA